MHSAGTGPATGAECGICFVPQRATETPRSIFVLEPFLVNTTTLQTKFHSLTGFVRRYGVFIAVTVLLGFGLFFVLNGRGEIAEAISLIATINPIWIAILAILQVVILVIAGWTYQVVLLRQGYRVGLLRLIEVHFQRIVIGAVTPLGGPASIYVLVRSLRSDNVRDSDSLLLASIRGISGVLSFLLFLVPVLLLQPPTMLVMIATIGLFVALAFTLWASVLVLRQQDMPGFVYRWAPRRILTFVETAKTHRMRVLDFAAPTALSFASHVVTAMLLFAGLQAVGFSAEVSTVLIGYVVGKLFFMMAPVFQGIGFVEIGMVIALQQAGVPAAFAVGGALLYRVGDLWLPLSWGFVLQVIRMPIREHLAIAFDQARDLSGGLSGLVHQSVTNVSGNIARLGHIAMVTESPLALTFGAALILAGGLPLTG